MFLLRRFLSERAGRGVCPCEKVPYHLVVSKESAWVVNPANLALSGIRLRVFIFWKCLLYSAQSSRSFLLKMYDWSNLIFRIRSKPMRSVGSRPGGCSANFLRQQWFVTAQIIIRTRKNRKSRLLIHCWRFSKSKSINSRRMSCSSAVFLFFHETRSGIYLAPSDLKRFNRPVLWSIRL